MPKITTSMNYEDNLEAAIIKIRQAFSKRFSSAYAEKILDEETNKGFSDLLRKFSDNEQEQLKKFTYQKLQRVWGFEEELFVLAGYVNSYQLAQNTFLPLYSGAGFDDEAAFLRMYISPADANAQDIDEYVRYQSDLEAMKRTFKSADFLLLEDDSGQVLAALIYHVLNTVDGKELVHVRQAFTTEAGGHMNLLLKELCEKFPNLIGEFNQRWGNKIPLRVELEQQGLLQEDKAVLGYSDKYNSYRTSKPLNSFWQSYQDYAKTRESSNNNTVQVPKLQS